jgi:hypothetical protein
MWLHKLHQPGQLATSSGGKCGPALLSATGGGCSPALLSLLNVCLHRTYIRACVCVCVYSALLQLRKQIF